MQKRLSGLPWITGSIAGLMAIIYIAIGPAPETWVFDRAALADGQIWRLFAAHWVHSDVGHLMWNLGGLLILGSSLERSAGGRQVVQVLMLGSLMVDLVVWLLLPELSYYCGLSGALNALLLPALYSLREQFPKSALLLVAFGSLLKIVIEQQAGQALFSNTAWVSVPLAHLAGWIVGLLLVIWVHHGHCRIIGLGGRYPVCDSRSVDKDKSRPVRPLGSRMIQPLGTRFSISMGLRSLRKTQ
jgi:rhomboid family GlyGly-CTERM serine protease